MSGYADVYVLAPERSAFLVRRFLGAFAPEREFSAEEIAVREASGRERRFATGEAAAEFCASSPGSSVSLYWHSLSPPPEHAMAFFLADGHLVLGVSTAESEARASFEALRRFFDPMAPGYIAFEQPPADTAADFLALCHDHRA